MTGSSPEQTLIQDVHSERLDFRIAAIGAMRGE
jgi:hypothetical protein